jgi:hypothetical protein
MILYFQTITIAQLLKKINNMKAYENRAENNGKLLLNSDIGVVNEFVITVKIIFIKFIRPKDEVRSNKNKPNSDIYLNTAG